MGWFFGLGVPSHHRHGEGVKTGLVGNKGHKGLGGGGCGNYSKRVSREVLMNF